MSAGDFNRIRYECDDTTTIVRGKAQPETVALDIDGATNDVPAGSVTFGISAYARKTTKQYGVGMRCVNLAWTGAPPTGYSTDIVSVPIFQKSVYDGISIGDAGTYLGQPVEVISKKAEQLT